MIVLLLVMVLIGLMKTDTEWAIFPAFAGIIGMFFTSAVLTDGSLSLLSGGTVNVIASANNVDTSIWTTIGLMPLIFTVTAFAIAIWKVGKAF